jgi:inner membrane protein
MDPLTQATIGAAAAAMVCRPAETRRAVVLGALAGAVPDLDVLIRSSEDPLLALEYHRHFTHGILMAPLIGLLMAALFKGIFFWKQWAYSRLALFATTGALTHGLIDTCTSYGTLLYWPLSGHRESWDVISIIDPIFTLPLVILTALAFLFQRPRLAQIAVTLCLVYLSFGLWQRTQATTFAENLAESRGHAYEALSVRPSFGNTVLWRIVYRVEDRYYVDAVRTLPWSSPVHYPGSSVPAYTPEVASAELSSGSVLAKDVERFRFFSQGYLHRHPDLGNVVGDTRYAMFPDSTIPLWGIGVDPANPDQHVQFEYFRDSSKSAFARLWQMILGRPVERSSGRRCATE